MLSKVGVLAERSMSISQKHHTICSGCIGHTRMNSSAWAGLPGEPLASIPVWVSLACPISGCWVYGKDTEVTQFVIMANHPG